jgi:hypothetical protein
VGREVVTMLRLPILYPRKGRNATVTTGSLLLRLKDVFVVILKTSNGLPSRFVVIVKSTVLKWLVLSGFTGLFVMISIMAENCINT